MAKISWKWSSPGTQLLTVTVLLVSICFCWSYTWLNCRIGKKKKKGGGGMRQEPGSHAQISIFIAWNPVGSSTECQLSSWLTETNMHPRPRSNNTAYNTPPPIHIHTHTHILYLRKNVLMLYSWYTRRQKQFSVLTTRGWQKPPVLSQLGPPASETMVSDYNKSV